MTKRALATQRFTTQELFDAVNGDSRVKAYTQLVVTLHALLVRVNPQPGKGMCVMNGDKEVDDARNLLRDLGEFK